MSYRLTTFDGVNLPTYNKESGLDAAPALPGFVSTVAGAFDSYGVDLAPMALPHAISARGIVSADTDAGQRAAIEALRTLTRRRAKLVREADDDASEHWAWARLMSLVQRRIYNARGYQALELGFLIESGWYEDQPDDLQYPLGSPHIMTVYNDGNRMIDDAIITFHADDAPLTALTITAPNGTHLIWTGTVATETDLVIDCGAKSILNDGVDAYSGLSYGANHTIDDWLRLEPYSINITYTYTGGGNIPSINIARNRGWV